MHDHIIFCTVGPLALHGYISKTVSSRLKAVMSYLTSQKGPSVNKEYLSQIQLYSIFGELPVLSNTVLIIDEKKRSPKNKKNVKKRKKRDKNKKTFVNVEKTLPQ